jgi:hypothetical protein
MTATAPPAVRLYIGMSVFDLKARNPSVISIDRTNDKLPVVVETPVIVLMEGEGNAVATFDATEMLWIDQAGAIVTGVSFAPQRDLANLATAYQILTRNLRFLRESGWRADVEASSSQQGLEDRYLKRKSHALFSAGFGIWRKGALQVEVIVKEVRNPEKLAEPDLKNGLFLVNLDFRDPVLAEQMLDRVYEARRQVNKSDGEPLPLSYWRK